jgi:hypothetical protein
MRPFKKLGGKQEKNWKNEKKEEEEKKIVDRRSKKKYLDYTCFTIYKL